MTYSLTLIMWQKSNKDFLLTCLGQAHCLCHRTLSKNTRTQKCYCCVITCQTGSVNMYTYSDSLPDIQTYALYTTACMWLPTPYIHPCNVCFWSIQNVEQAEEQMCCEYRVCMKTQYHLHLSEVFLFHIFWKTLLLKAACQGKNVQSEHGHIFSLVHVQLQLLLVLSHQQDKFCHF